MGKNIVRAVGGLCVLVAACMQAPTDGTNADEASAASETTQGSPPAVAVAKQAIVNGDAADDVTAEFGGFVTLQILESGVLTPYCSGVLITNTQFLTAEHCVDDERVDQLFKHPQDMTVSLGYGTGYQQDQNGYTVYIQSDPDRDYAMVDVAAPFLMPLPDGTLSTSGYSRPIGSVSDGEQVMCFGSSGGQLRSASMTATITYFGDNDSSMFYKYHQNANGQIQEPGDSGGACVSLNPYNGLWANAQLVSTNVSCFGSDWCTAEASIYKVFDSWTSVTTSR
jgi:hypothetical protein